MMLPKLIVLIAVFTVCFLSCKKEEKAPELNLKEKLEKVEWQLYGVFLETPPDPLIADITENTRYECEKDDLLKFSSDGYFNVYDGSDLCSGGGRSVFSSLDNGGWSVNNTDSSVTISQGFNTQTFKIKELTNKLVFTKKERNYFNGEDLYSYYFAPK
jgi:hypothetical protein